MTAVYNTPHKQMIIGIAEPVSVFGCVFKIVGYITIDRANNGAMDALLTNDYKSKSRALNTEEVLVILFCILIRYMSSARNWCSLGKGLP